MIPRLARLAAGDDRRRAAARARHRRWRSRQQKDEAVYPVVVSYAVIHALIDWGWLQESESADRRQVAKAIADMLTDAARHHEKNC
jgi:hypothetical protein